MYRLYVKRFLDFWMSLIVLIIISPLLLLVTIWLYYANKGAGALFFQERPGKDGKIFRVIKFKTMTDERDADGNLLPDEVRLTNVGRFVRSTSIDELPQLINVLKGDMSLWAQCHGRNQISWTEKFKLDVWYVDHLSFMTDLKVIMITIKKVLFREDINSDNDATMEDFDGTN